MTGCALCCCNSRAKRTMSIAACCNESRGSVIGLAPIPPEEQVCNDLCLADGVVGSIVCYVCTATQNSFCASSQKHEWNVVNFICLAIHQNAPPSCWSEADSEKGFAMGSIPEVHQSLCRQCCWQCWSCSRGPPHAHWGSCRRCRCASQLAP